MKRLFDIAGAVAGLVLLCPVLLVTAVLVRIYVGSPIFFVQERPGLRGKPFRLIKFRTMIDERNDQGELLPDANRIHAFGRALRASSLDEIPELWNILKGEMSFVGPRPLLMEYLPLFSPQQMRRHDVRPGLTGWAQITGRNCLLWSEKFELDVWYVENRSFWLDLKIVALTVGKVISREGISQEGEATMTRFSGSEAD